MASSRPKRAVKPVQRNTPATAPVGTWVASRILTSKSSVTAKSVDSFLGLLIMATTGWDDKYDDEERRAIISAFPPKFQIYNVDPVSGKLQCPIDTGLVLDNPTLKQAVAKVRDEIKDGYHEVTWLNQAQKATQQRQSGVFDEYLKQHAEELFGDSPTQGSTTDNHAEDGEEDDVMTSDGEWSTKGSVKKPKLRRSRGSGAKAIADTAMEDVGQ